MKKMLLLSLLCIPATTQCMEKETQITNHPLQYSDIKKEVSKLDELLYDDQHWYHGSNNDLAMLVIGKFPEREFKYVEDCEDGGTGLYYDIILKKANPTVLANMHCFKSANYKGYSCISAVILSTEVRYEEKKNIIWKLKKAGLKETEKDRLLALHLEQETQHNRNDDKSDLLDQEIAPSSNFNPFDNITALFFTGKK